MLALAETIDGARVRTQRPVIFAATVGEEGAGDLRGVKHLFARLDDTPSACIALDGAGDDRIVHRALGARRFRVTFHGCGGHSWAAFGMPNPVHAAGATAAKLASVPLPRAPRTTLSVCRIGGGISVNAIPTEAWLEVDVRCSSADILAACASEVEMAVRAAVREENARRSSGRAAAHLRDLDDRRSSLRRAPLRSSARRGRGRRHAGHRTLARAGDGVHRRQRPDQPRRSGDRDRRGGTRRRRSHRQ